MAEETKKSGKAKGVERWWSTTDPKHMIMFVGDDGETNYIRFDGYGLELDLNNPEDAAKSKALHACGREGRDIFVVGESYDEHEFGTNTEFMRMLRRIAQEYDGVSKIRGLFGYNELVKAGIPPATNDADALIMLALRSKSIKDL